MIQPPYLVGQMLLAMPGMSDPRFDRTAIAMCVHDENGALGLIINQIEHGIDARALMAQLGVDPGTVPVGTPVYAGGPCEPQRGFVLHSLDYNHAATLQVSGAWGLTATLEILRDIAGGTGPKRWLLALGYSGWGPGQLDAEMTRHGWFAAPASPDLIWSRPADERWSAAFAGAGVDVAALSAVAGSA